MITRLLHLIVSIPWVYDAVQKLAGRERTYRWLATYLSEASGKVVLDLGGGTGELATQLPPTATYIWLDNDVDKLKGLRRKIEGARALLGDASHIGLKNKSVDLAICIALSHHLSDAQLADTFREIARICRFKLFFLDAIRHPALMSRLMWKYDRGSHPRSVEELRSYVESYFVIENEIRTSVFHQYWFCAAAPKSFGEQAASPSSPASA
jgi:ubiquinone/menaquinone biosynthesis C-methylase UbiE